MRGIDRRKFLTTAGASVATPLLLGCEAMEPKPKAVTGLREEIPPSEQITVGAIGIGIRLRNIMHRAFLKDPRIRVVAVCDVDTTRREYAKTFVDEAYGKTDCRAFVDYRELLDHPGLDAVVIGTPDHWHTLQCIHAAQAGKDIYCEKPLTHMLGENSLIIEAVRKHDRVFQTGSQQRSEFGHKFATAVEYVRNGRIGRVLSVHVGVGDPSRAYDLEAEAPEPGLDWDRWLGPAADRPYNSVLSPRKVHRHYPQWRRYWDFAGGGVADMGAHHFDITQWALDADDHGPVVVHPPADERMSRGARVVYESGVTVVHGGPSGATFVGTDGMIHVDRGRLSSTPDGILKAAIGDDDLHIPRNKSHVDDWIRCIKSRERPICDVEIGARSAAICQLLNLAYRHGRTMAWDPAAWKFTDDTPAEWMDYDRRAGYEMPAL